jgi:hypothetical protein
MLADCLKIYGFIRVFADTANHNRSRHGKQGELPALARLGHGRRIAMLKALVQLWRLCYAVSVKAGISEATESKPGWQPCKREAISGVAWLLGRLHLRMKSNFPWRVLGSFFGNDYGEGNLFNGARQAYGAVFGSGFDGHNSRTSCNSVNIVFLSPYCANQIDGLIGLQLGHHEPILRNHALRDFLGTICGLKRRADLRAYHIFHAF